MTERERFLRTLRYQSVDRRPIYLAGPWPDTLTRWRAEGLPAEVDVHEYMDVPALLVANISPTTAMDPPFETEILEETDECVIRTDRYGRTVREFKDHTSMPEWIDFPVKDAADLERVLAEHYQVDDLDRRFPEDWARRARTATEEDKIIVIDGGCYYWTLRSIAGVERASYLFYDAPDLVEELFERYLTVVLEGIRRATRLKGVEIDVIGFGEDIAFKNGPLISPRMFRRFVLPRYRKVMRKAHERGVDLTWYDSDGDVRSLIPDYLSVGINTLAPCEVAAGMVPQDLRNEFGRELRMIGGIDKRRVAEGPDAIDAEIERNQSLIGEGGFIPGIDHSVSSDISFDNYRYFVDRLQEAVAM
jgi:uroporphyrinogen decarboxylase